MPKITVVTLCGSAKFEKEFKTMAVELALKGIAVLSPVFYEESEVRHLSQETVQQLKRAHYRKIELADEIVVMDVGGYIGESTRREIAFAQRNQKGIRYYSDLLPASEKEYS